MPPFPGEWSIGRGLLLRRGMNFFRARRKAAGIADRRSANVCRGWTMQRRWGLMSFIFRRFIRSVTPIAKAETTRSPASRATRACHGRSAARPADTRQSSRRSAHLRTLIGCRNRCANAEWRLPWISQSIARPIIPTSKRIPNGSTNGPMERSSTPKKYEDIYPLNFRCEDWRELWAEMKSIVLFWAEHGVRIFRVDNPHTKPVAFWEYLITGVREKYPDTIFLSEAFTRPKMMKALAKAGFSQSYTYFTWRNTKHELIEYFTELTQTEMSEYFRPNLWPNTPDILSPILQDGGRPAFMTRVLMAATLSPVYGIYSGYELCEKKALPGREEYLDSEKYQFKERDWNAPGNIKDWIARLNKIRKENRALQLYTNLRSPPADNEAILFYSN